MTLVRACVYSASTQVHVRICLFSSFRGSADTYLYRLSAGTLLSHVQTSCLGIFRGVKIYNVFGQVQMRILMQNQMIILRCDNWCPIKLIYPLACVYTYTHTHTLTHTYIDASIHMHTYMHERTHALTHTSMHTCMRY